MEQTSEQAVQALVEEVLADANKRAQQAVKEAQREAERLRKKSTEKLQKERERLLSTASAKAEAEEKRMKERLELDLRRELLKNKYTLMDAILEDALKELREREGSDPHILAELAAEAIRAMECGETILLYVSPSNEKALKEFGIENWRQEVLKRAAMDVRLEVKDDPHISGGVLVASETGTLRYDNTFQARLSRQSESVLSEVDRLLVLEEEEKS